MKAFTCGPFLALIASWLALSGCQPEAAPPPSPTPATPTPAAAPVDPSTESSLSIKRGIVMLTTESRTLRLCGENADLWLAGEGDALDEIYSRLAGEPGAALYVEARGERTATPQGTTIPATYAQTFLLEQVLFAAMPGEGGACAAGPPPWRVRASGNEPFWSVEITAERIRLREPEPAMPLDLPVAESQDSEGTVTYRAAGEGHVLELVVTALACSDSMSGAYFAYTAEGKLDGRELRGCARLGE